MKKIFYTFLAIFFIPQVSWQQHQFEWYHHGMPGDTARYSVTALVDFMAVDTQTGPAFLWDFTNLEAQTQVVQRIIDKDDSGFFAGFLATCTFGGTNPFECFQLWESLSSQAMVTIDSLRFGQIALSNALRFQRINTEALEETMIGFQFNNNGLEIPLILIYTNPDTVLRFPINYDDSHTSSFSWSLDLTQLGIDIIYRAHQTRVYAVDGWGLLHTPFHDSLSTLRIKTTVTNSDTVTFNGVSTPLVNTATIYSWWDTSYTMPVLEVIRSIGAITNLFSVRYLDSIRCIPPVAGFGANPQNPNLDSLGNAEIQLQNFSANADQYTWDFGDGSISQSSNPTHTYQSAGQFEITLIACNNVCVPLACDTSFLQISVSDTTTAISLPKKFSRYQIYPNPASKAFSVKGPDLHSTSMRIFNFSGMELIAQSWPFENVNIQILPVGTYWLALENHNSRIVLPLIKIE